MHMAKSRVRLTLGISGSPTQLTIDARLWRVRFKRLLDSALNFNELTAAGLILRSKRGARVRSRRVDTCRVAPKNNCSSDKS